MESRLGCCLGLLRCPSDPGQALGGVQDAADHVRTHLHVPEYAATRFGLRWSAASSANDELSPRHVGRHRDVQATSKLHGEAKPAVIDQFNLEALKPIASHGPLGERYDGNIIAASRTYQAVGSGLDLIHGSRSQSLNVIELACALFDLSTKNNTTKTASRSIR